MVAIEGNVTAVAERGRQDRRAPPAGQRGECKNDGLCLECSRKARRFCTHLSDRRAEPAGLVFPFPPQLSHYPQSLPSDAASKTVFSLRSIFLLVFIFLSMFLCHFTKITAQTTTDGYAYTRESRQRFIEKYFVHRTKFLFKSCYFFQNTCLQRKTVKESNGVKIFLFRLFPCEK